MVADSSSLPEDRKPTRQERIEAMRDMVEQVRADGTAEISDAQLSELVLWASVEYAAVHHLVEVASRVIRAIHPSVAASTEDSRLSSEVTMYLLEAAAEATRNSDVPKDLAVKSFMVYLGDKNAIDPPDDEEQQDFEAVLHGSTN